MPTPKLPMPVQSHWVSCTLPSAYLCHIRWFPPSSDEQFFAQLVAGFLTLALRTFARYMLYARLQQREEHLRNLSRRKQRLERFVDEVLAQPLQWRRSVIQVTT